MAARGPPASERPPRLPADSSAFTIGVRPNLRAQSSAVSCSPLRAWTSAPAAINARTTAASARSEATASMSAVIPRRSRSLTPAPARRSAAVIAGSPYGPASISAEIVWILKTPFFTLMPSSIAGTSIRAPAPSSRRTRSALASRPVATRSGERPRLVLTVASAPRATSNPDRTGSPLAQTSAVAPNALRASMSAPASRMSRIASGVPATAASISGVMPCRSRRFGSARTSSPSPSYADPTFSPDRTRSQARVRAPRSARRRSASTTWRGTSGRGSRRDPPIAIRCGRQMAARSRMRPARAPGGSPPMELVRRRRSPRSAARPTGRTTATCCRSAAAPARYRWR